MAKVSAVERNLKRQRLVAKYAAKRALLKDTARDRDCLLYTSPSPRDRQKSRMPSSA